MCTCPCPTSLGEEGGGFALAQARLGPGRIHHCMRCIGMAETGLELVCRRVVGRQAFGKSLAEQGVIQEWIADSRIEIEQARLLAMKHRMAHGRAWATRAARIEISAIKVVAPNMALQVVDRAIQARGGGGVSRISRSPACTQVCAHCASPMDPTRSIVSSPPRARAYLQAD